MVDAAATSAAEGARAERGGRDPRPASSDCTDDDWQRCIDVEPEGPVPVHAARRAAHGRGRRRVDRRPGLDARADRRAAVPGLLRVEVRAHNLCKQVAIEHAADGVRVNVLSLVGHRHRAVHAADRAWRPTPRRSSAMRGRQHADGAARAAPTRCATTVAFLAVDGVGVHQRRGAPARRRPGGAADVMRRLGACSTPTRTSIEPGARVRAWTRAAPDADGPARRHADACRAATSTCWPTNSSTASTRRRTCGRWTRRASTRPCSTRRSGCSCRSCPSSTPRESRRRVPRLQRVDRGRTAPPIRAGSPASASCRWPTSRAAAQRGRPGAPTRPGRRDGAPEPPLRPQPGRPGVRPAVRRAWPSAGIVLAVHEGLGLRGPTIGTRPLHRRSPPGTRCRTRWSRWRRWRASCSRARSSATRRCGSRSSSRAPAGCPYWLHASTSTRVDGGLRVRALRSAAEYFARQCVISQRGRRRLVGVGRRGGRRRPRDVGERLPPSGCGLPGRPPGLRRQPRRPRGRRRRVDAGAVVDPPRLLPASRTACTRRSDQ